MTMWLWNAVFRKSYFKGMVWKYVLFHGPGTVFSLGCFLGCSQQSHLIKTKLMLRNKYVVKCADVRQLLWLNVILRSLKRFQTNVPWISLSEEVPFKMSVIVLNLRRVVLRRLCCGEFFMSIPKSKYCHNLLTLNQYVRGTQKIDQNKLKLFFHTMWYRN